MIYKMMEYVEKENKQFVMKFGELGTKFYIILRGKVSVRVPSIIEKDFTFRELLELLNTDHEWAINNDKFQEVLDLVHDIIPDLVTEDFRGNLKLNPELVKKVLNGKKLCDIQHNYQDGIPEFKDFNDFFRKFLVNFR